MGFMDVFLTPATYDFFLVGGGASGRASKDSYNHGGGGGSGYTTTKKSYLIQNKKVLTVSVGAGGTVQGNMGSMSYLTQPSGAADGQRSTPGTPNTGGGGGGMGYYSGDYGSNGGSGLGIVRWNNT